jgi:hypothetical protein
MNRWAVYDVFLGNPVLVTCCVTREEATHFIEKRGPRSCRALYVVELSDDAAKEPFAGNPVGHIAVAAGSSLGL